MVPITAVLVREKTEEKEDVAYAHPLIAEMGLRGTGLPEQAFATDKHRVIVTKVIASDLPAGHLLYELAQT